MKILCYHGTNADAARSILKEGFRPDSWFAVHLEDAIAYGGLHVFEVVFDSEKIPQDAWQFHVLSEISPKHIVSYSVFQQRKVFENSILREEIFKVVEQRTFNP